MFRPAKPLRRSIDGRRSESTINQSSRASMSSRRLSYRSLDASASLSTATAARCANTAPPELAEAADAEVTSTAVLPSLHPCTAEVYKVSDLRSVHPPQPLTSFSLGMAADFVDSAAAVAVADCAESYADGHPKEPSSPLKITTPHYACLHGFWDDTKRLPCMPKSAQRLFTSDEVSTLRSEALQTYMRRKRMEEQRELIAAEEEARSLLSEAAVDQIAAVRELQKEELQLRMRAVSEAALPVQYLEQRIRRRIDEEYAQQDEQLRQEGRAAWRLRVEVETATLVDTRTYVAERRAAIHRFRAALTFIIVQEMDLRKHVEAESAKFWEKFAQEEAEGKADAEHRALVRFLNTPEQLALAAAREKRERKRALRTAKLLKLFQEQQEVFVKGCRHGTGGVSLFVGDAPKKMCGRCRVKWDENLGYYVSLDHTVKTHPPPPPITAAADTEIETASRAAKRPPARTSKKGSVLPPLKKTLN
ncbi:hypothetical protein, conserved [Leishmania tarentolae]|uniref:Uncharacterized protein n=1 Tax=Leishmania tarentolae TaxID=5689 RepID=A0A640KJN8_LEITA|nr:hypothetical protein, conserved [Leishmania tarentolae]